LLAKLILLALVLLLSACQRAPTEQSMLADYRQRLARTLSVDLVAAKPITLPAYPSRRDLQQVIEIESVDLLEFLRLSQCQLQRLIGARNSSLGRHMADSQRWLYEAEFLELAEVCLGQLLRDPSQVELQEMLMQVMAIKREQKTAVVWNATFASSEFQSLFAIDRELLASDAQAPGQLREALSSLRWSAERWLEHARSPRDGLEEHYQVVGRASDLGGLQHTLAVVTAELVAANALLAQRLDQRPLCFNGKASAQAKILETVFYKFYVGEVQPYLAKVYQHTEPLVSELQTINDQLIDAGVLEKPDSFDKYWRANWSGQASLWQRFNTELDQHTELWQAHLSACGLMPGQ
jgi:hypothetical protein